MVSTLFDLVYAAAIGQVVPPTKAIDTAASHQYHYFTLNLNIIQHIYKV